MSQNLFVKTLSFMKRTHNSDCSKIETQLFAYLEGELNAVEQTVLDRHLLHCEACRIELEQCRRSEAALASALTSVPAPGDLRPGFYAKLAQSRQPRPILAGWRVAVPALAAVTLLIVCARPWLFSKMNVNQVTPSTGGSNQANTQHNETRVRNTVSARPQPPATIKPDAHRMIASVEPVRKTKGYKRRAERREIVQYASLSLRPKHRQQLLQIARLDWNRAAQSTTFSVPIKTYATGLAPGLSVNSNLKVPATELLSSSAHFAEDRPVYRDRAKSTKQDGEIVLASLVNKAELHISDEERDFMSSTHINGVHYAHDKGEGVSVDDDNETAQQPVELPALP